MRLPIYCNYFLFIKLTDNLIYKKHCHLQFTCMILIKNNFINSSISYRIIILILIYNNFIQ